MPNPPDTPSDPSKNNQTRSQKIQGALLVPTILIALAAVGVGIFQAGISREQMRLAQETSVEQLRARIAPLGFKMIEDLDSSPKPMGHIIFKNLGDTPAMKVAYYIRTSTIERSQWPNEGAIESKIEQIIASNNLPPCSNLPLGTTDFVVHPSKDSSRFLQFRFKPGEIDAEVRAGRKFLMVVGCFVYETFREHRFSSFCGYIDSTADPNPPSQIKKWYPAICRNGIGNSAN